jgi:very-short-patch-repair endonuclease
VRLAVLATRQNGIVGYRQLLRIGFDKSAIARRVASGRLHRLYRGVFAVGHRVVSLRGRWTAAVLACGPGAALSHRDGGQLWAILQSSRREVDVTVPRSRAGIPGIAMHRSRSLDPRDWGRLHGIPVTSLPRTLLDLADVLDLARLRRALEEADRMRRLDLNAIRETLARHRGRRGGRGLREAIEAMFAEARYTKSDLEVLLLELCREFGLPQPVMNALVEGYEVDAHWPGTNVIAELDSWRFHRTREAFERDRAKNLALEAAGYVVPRLTWRQLTVGRADTAASLGTLIAAGALAQRR